MNPRSILQFSIALAAVAVLAVGEFASAQSPTSWTRGASTFGSWPGTGSWNLSTGPEPDANTQVLVGVNTFTMAAGLSVSTGVGNVSGSAAGIVFTNTTAKYLRGQPGNNANANDHRLRIASSGITLTSTSGATGNVALGLFVNNSFAPVTPAGTFVFDFNNAQTFTNNSASYLQLGQSNWTTGVFIRPGVDSIAGTHALTFSGTGTGSFDIYGIVQDQPADATKIRSLVINRTDPAAGVVRLFANNTYTGPTSITAGTLLIQGTNSGGGATTVGSGGVLGGLGSLAGPITFDSGSRLLFNPTGPLTVSGTVSFSDPSSFGIDDIVGLDSTVTLGTYTLIAGTVNSTGLANLGVANAATLGGGKWAYFQPGSLEVVVSAVPEPATGGMLAAVGIAAAAAWRSRKSRSARRMTNRSFACCLAAALTLTTACQARVTAAAPNVVVMLVDDLGVGDCGFSGGTDIPTPCIDRLAREGAVCTSAYVTPSCSPTRAAILTGRYPGRFGIEDNRPLDGPTAGMDLREALLPQLLRKQGYATALIGKWHLGRGPHGPLARGFESFCGWIGASGRYIDPPLLRDDGPTATSEVAVGWVDDILADRAAAFVRDHATRPFFLHVAFMAAHLKQEALPEDLARFAHLDGKRRMAAAIISRLDRAVGRVLDTIHDTGLDKQTLVFFLSDNGGEPPVLGTSNGPHRGQKFDVLEGGIRVPFAIRWTGVVPEGTVFAPMVHGMDVFATAAAAAAVASPNPIDGVDLVPYLRGEKAGVPHERLFWVYNDHADWRRADQDTNLARRLLAVREGNWKLIVEGAALPRLYDVAVDPAEARDLAAREPARVQDLGKALEEWQSSMVRQVIPPDHPVYGRNRQLRP